MYMVGKQIGTTTIFKPGFIDNIDEAKKIGERECDSRGWIVIQEFAKHNYLMRLNTREGPIWVERNK